MYINVIKNLLFISPKWLCWIPKKMFKWLEQCLLSWLSLLPLLQCTVSLIQCITETFACKINYPLSSFPPGISERTTEHAH